MKDPAFLFYSSDFLSGVTDLTMEERGQYITLICLQHQKGHLPEKTIRLSVGSVSVDVLKKFKQDNVGNYFNERLETEILKRAEFVDSRRNNGQKGGRPKANAKPSGYPNGYPSAKPLGLAKNNLPENENRNVNRIVNEIGDKTKNFVLIYPPDGWSPITKIYGIDGLREFYESNLSALPRQEFAEKYLRDRAGKHLKDFSHLFSDYNLFVKEQYK